MASTPLPRAWAYGERALPSLRAGWRAGRPTRSTRCLLNPHRRWSSRTHHTPHTPPIIPCRRCRCCCRCRYHCPPLPACRRIAFLGSGLLLLSYVGAAALALRLPSLFNPWAMGAGHAVLALVLLYKTIKLDAAGYSAAGIKDYYAAVWCAWRHLGGRVRLHGVAARVVAWRGGAERGGAGCWGDLAEGMRCIVHCSLRCNAPLHPSLPPPRRLNFYCEYLLLPFLAA